MSSTFPKKKSKVWIEELAHYLISEPFPFVIDLEKSKGMWITTVDGDRLFDWTGLYASKLLGYNHPDVFATPEAKKKLLHAASNKMANPDFLTIECVEYYREIYRRAPKCMRNPKLEVYAVNSGAEAVENMMKYLINLHHEKLIQQRKIAGNKRFIYFDQAFHGRTIFALNVTQLDHDPIITKDFQGFVPGNLQVPFPSIESHLSPEENRARYVKSLEIVEDLLKRYKGEIVGIIIEPIQGAGGHRVAAKEFFQKLSELAHTYDTYLGFDEVQTAGGQLGAFFAVDLFDLPYPPQAVASAKKLGNGVVFMLHPMDDNGVLDSTWGGNLVDMVRFCEEMKVLDREDLIGQVPQKTKLLVEGLDTLVRKHPTKIANPRGLGLYQGFSVRKPENKSALIQLCLNKYNLLLLGAGTDSIRFRPALDVTEKEIEHLMELLDKALKELAA